MSGTHANDRTHGALMNLRTLGSIAFFAMLAAACSRQPAPATAAMSPHQPVAPLHMSDPGDDPDTPVAPPHDTPRQSAPGHQGPCEADSDCAGGETCVGRIDYGGCEECTGGSVIRQCERSDRQSTHCPAGLDCEPSADGGGDSRCGDPEFRKRCPDTVIGL